MAKTTATETKETAAKNVAGKAADTEKTAKKAAEKTVPAKKEPTKTVTEKAAPAKKEPTKAATAKKAAAARKATVKETVYLQYLGKEINKDDLTKQVKTVWTKQLKKKVSDLKSIDLYLKPEENAVYYVINGDVTGSLEI